VKTREELLADVLASPDDDAPRLVYADWLTEHGDPYGEYITISCRENQSVYYGEEAVRMRNRLQELDRTHGATWRAPFEQHARPGSLMFSRGFPACVDMDARAFVEHFAELVALAPIYQVTLIDLDDETAARVADCPAARNVYRYYVRSRGGLSLDGFSALADSRHFAPGALVIGTLSTAAARTLARGKAFAGLQELSVTVDDAGVQELVALPALRKLSLLDGRVGPAGAQALAAMPSLRELVMSDQPVGDEGLVALASSPFLEELYAPRCEASREGVAAAVAAVQPALRTLDLSGNPVDARVFTREPPFGLRCLYLARCQVDVEAILRSPSLPSLVELRLEGEMVTPEALRLLRAPAILPSLELITFDDSVDLTDVLDDVLRTGPWSGSLNVVRAG
jgi:uncharacterized protein (TIGR02996 family)